MMTTQGRIRMATAALITSLATLGLLLIGGWPSGAAADEPVSGLTVTPDGAASMQGGVLVITQDAELEVTGQVTLPPIATDKVVTISGSGSLTITESGATPGIEAGSLTINDNPQITATIKTTGPLVVNGGTLTATTSVFNKNAVCAGSAFTMTAGTINATVTNLRGTQLGGGSALKFGHEIDTSDATITGGQLNLTVDNTASIGGVPALMNGNGTLTIGTERSVDGPTVNVTTKGIGFGEGLLVHDLVVHSGTLNVDASIGTSYLCALNATQFTMDGGTATIKAAGSAIHAITASSTTLKNATGTPGQGPTLTAYGSNSAFASRETLNLEASSYGTPTFYPWLIQSGTSESAAQVISFAGAANMKSNHGLVNSAGQWMKIQPAEIQEITFTTNNLSAAPSETVELTPYVRFADTVTPPVRFGSSLASMVELLPIDTSQVTAAPANNVGSVTANGTRGVTVAVAPGAKGRTTTFTPVLNSAFTGAGGTWAEVYGSETKLRGLALPMRYPVKFDANGGTLTGQESVVTNAHGLVPAASIPTAAKEGSAFAGWSKTAAGGEVLDLNTATFDEPTTLYAQWAEGSLALVATPKEQVAGATVHLTVDSTLGEGDPYEWEITAKGAHTSTVNPSPVEGASNQFTWTVPAEAEPTDSYDITVTVGGVSATQTITVKDGSFATFDGNGGQPKTQQVVFSVTPKLSTLTSLVSPENHHHFQLGWYSQKDNKWVRLEPEQEVQPNTTYTAQWATVEVNIEPKTVALAPGQRTVDFTIEVTVKPDQEGVTLYEGFSAGAGALAVKAVGGEATALEYSAFDYETGKITGSFSWTVDPSATSGRVSIIGDDAEGTEFHNSVAAIGVQSSSPSGPAVYAVTLDGNGGTWDEATSKSLSVNANGRVTVPEGLARDGYRFAGWERKVNGEWVAVDLDTYRVTGPVTLRAVWAPIEVDVPTVAVYRLWNSYSGAHLITADLHEYETLGELGWVPEGVAFHAVAEGTPVWRLYNPHNGDHFYTADEHEYVTLQTRGWRGEDVKLQGAGADGVPVWRLWNQLQVADAGLGSHLWTTDENEYATLPLTPPAGAWVQEEIAWYAAPE